MSFLADNEIADKFLIISTNEKDYENDLRDVIKSISQSDSRICYACLNKPYEYVADNMKAIGIDIGKFLFVDTMSSHYGKPPADSRCIFLEPNMCLDDLSSAIADAISERGCDIILFDTFSALLSYHVPFSLVKFANNMKIDVAKGGKSKLFILLKEEVMAMSEGEFIKDMEMLADKNIDASSMVQKKKIN